MRQITHSNLPRGTISSAASQIKALWHVKVCTRPFLFSWITPYKPGRRHTSPAFVFPGLWAGGQPSGRWSVASSLCCYWICLLASCLGVQCAGMCECVACQTRWERWPLPIRRGQWSDQRWPNSVGGISDPLVLPSATWAPVKFPAAVCRDGNQWYRWGDDGERGGTWALLWFLSNSRKAIQFLKGLWGPFEKTVEHSK